MAETQRKTHRACWLFLTASFAAAQTSARAQSSEDAAIESGCQGAILDTMSFQAPAFYEKRGYVRVGVVDGYPGGAQKIFLRKALARPSTQAALLPGSPGGREPT